MARHRQWQVGIRISEETRYWYLQQLDHRRLSQSGIISGILEGIRRRPELLDELLDAGASAGITYNYVPPKELHNQPDQPIRREAFRARKDRGDFGEWYQEADGKRFNRALHAFEHPGEFLTPSALELLRDWRHKATRQAQEARVVMLDGARKTRARIFRQWRELRTVLCAQVVDTRAKLASAEGRRARMFQRLLTEQEAKLRDFDQEIRLDERPMLKLSFKYAAAQVGFIEPRQVDDDVDDMEEPTTQVIHLQSRRIGKAALERFQKSRAEDAARRNDS